MTHFFSRGILGSILAVVLLAAPQGAAGEGPANEGAAVEGASDASTGAESAVTVTATSESTETGTKPQSTQGTLTPEQQEAQVFFDEGSQYYAEGDFESAVTVFKRAYEIVQSPEIVYNIARSHEALGQEKDAAYNYEIYLRLSPDAEDADEVKARIKALHETIEKEELEAQRTAQKNPKVDEDEKWYTGLRIGGQAGIMAPVLSDWERMVLPAYLLIHLPLNRVVQFSLVGIVAIPAQRNENTDRDEVTGTVGVFAGFRFVGDLSKRFALFARTGLLFLGLAREYHNRTTLLLGGEIAPGFTLNVTAEWRFVLEINTDIGVIFPGLLNDQDLWGNQGDTTLALVVGGLLGFEYEF